jgi:flagellar FliL protein
MAKHSDAPAAAEAASKAKKKPHGDAPAEIEAPGKGKKKPLILIGAAVFVLLIGGVAAWYLVGHKSQPPAASTEAKPKHAGPPVFVTLEPFVVNLAGDVQHYLQVGIDLRVVDGHVQDQVKLHLPEIRNGVLLLLSSKSVEDLSSVESKNHLRAELREAVNKPLGINTPAPKPAAAPDAPKPEGMGEAHAAEPLVAKGASHKGEERKADDTEAGVMEVLLTSFVIQ